MKLDILSRYTQNLPTDLKTDFFLQWIVGVWILNRILEMWQQYLDLEQNNPIKTEYH